MNRFTSIWLSRVVWLMLGMLPTALPASALAAPAAILEPGQVRDQGGRKLVFAAPYERIISLYSAHTENLLALGLFDRIIGVDRTIDHPRVADKPRFSYREDPEKFLAAKPDLVLVRPMIDRGYPQLIRRLESSGITVASLQPATVEQMYTYWRILGHLTGREQRAEVMVTGFRQRVSAIRDLTRDIAPKKRVYFEAIHSKMKTFAPTSMAVFALETAGGINIAHDAKPVRGTNIAAFGKERLLSRGNRIDVFLSQQGTMNRPTVDMLITEPGFQAIKAIRNNEVYLVDEVLVSRPTLRLLAGMCEIGRRLYPHLFSQPVRSRFLEEMGALTGWLSHK